MLKAAFILLLRICQIFLSVCKIFFLFSWLKPSSWSQGITSTKWTQIKSKFQKKKVPGNNKENSLSGKDWPKGPWIGNCILRKVSCRYWGEELSFPTAAGELTAVCQTTTQGTSSCWTCFLMFGPLTTYWRVSEIPMCLKEEREDTGYHDFSRFLPGLAAGTESRMSIEGQWSVREKMQQTFLHQTKPLCSCTSSCFSSLPLLRWLFALLLLEQLKFLWPGKGAIAGVHELP